jgi:hypothetical protein
VSEERAHAWRRQLRELGAVAASVLPTPQQPRALIFAQGRTGSTLLESLLESTGHLRGFGELLAPVMPPVRDPVRYVEGLSRWHRSGFVWHCKPYHLTDDRVRAGVDPVDPHSVLASLVDSGWLIIHLHRRDLVRHMLSNLVARRRGAYHKRDAAPEDLSVIVTRDVLERTVARRRAHSAAEAAALAGLPHHRLVYEEDLLAPARHQATVDGILTLLGLPSRPVHTDLTRINARPLSELVVNYDEFAVWVRELGLHESLDE